MNEERKKNGQRAQRDCFVPASVLSIEDEYEDEDEWVKKALDILNRAHQENKRRGSGARGG
jgi:hypothetical protein